MNADEIKARQAVWNQFRSSFNTFAGAYNTALAGLKPFEAEYVAGMRALRLMASAVNSASPAVTAAIDAANALEPDPPPPNESPNKTRGVQLVDQTGGIWTLGPSGQTMRNGQYMGGGLGVEYYYLDHAVYARSSNGIWYGWSGSAWGAQGTTLPGETPPPPEPKPKIDATVGPIVDGFVEVSWRSSNADSVMLNRKTDAGVVLSDESVPVNGTKRVKVE